MALKWIPSTTPLWEEYGKQQWKTSTVKEARKNEVYEKVPAVKGNWKQRLRGVLFLRKKNIGRQSGCHLWASWKTGRSEGQKALLIKAARFSDDYPGASLPLSKDCEGHRMGGWTQCHCFLRAQMETLYAQSNLERVLEQENFDKLSFQYYDNSQIIPEIGMTNADYMHRVVEAAWNFVENFDSEAR